MLELEFFYLLKSALLKKYQESYPEWRRTIHDFRGREIANFQQLLQEKVHSRISEKWFYTHLKPTQNEKLPRIDMLDLLSQFLDYSDWDDFKKQQEEIDLTTEVLKEKKKTKSGFSIQQMILIIACFLGLIVLWSAFLKEKSNMYTFCFVDADTKQSIQNKDLKIEIFQKEESPLLLEADENGCFEWNIKNEKITFAVNAPYFKSDTITRHLQNQNKTEIIYLYRDDYAWMIHIFSNAKIKDWEKRRNQLNEMLADDAVIFQVEKNNLMLGLEMLNKEEFIDRMTLPINSLKNIKIIQTVYKDDQISKLRFIVEE